MGITPLFFVPYGQGLVNSRKLQFKTSIYSYPIRLDLTWFLTSIFVLSIFDMMLAFSWPCTIQKYQFLLRMTTSATVKIMPDLDSAYPRYTCKLWWNRHTDSPYKNLDYSSSPLLHTTDTGTNSDFNINFDFENRQSNRTTSVWFDKLIEWLSITYDCF